MGTRVCHTFSLIDVCFVLSNTSYCFSFVCLNILSFILSIFTVIFVKSVFLLIYFLIMLLQWPLSGLRLRKAAKINVYYERNISFNCL